MPVIACPSVCPTADPFNSRTTFRRAKAPSYAKEWSVILDCVNGHNIVEYSRHTTATEPAVAAICAIMLG
eukprot:m.17278 g.17278  ORF g.17278 m.17278 type:complete len:70 (+) comp10663_c0_seq4:985-1194(+)